MRRFLSAAQAGRFNLPVGVVPATPALIRQHGAGTSIKIAIQAGGSIEKCWATITAVHETTVEAVIDNDLYFTKFHGLDDGSKVTLAYEQVCYIWAR